MKRNMTRAAAILAASLFAGGAFAGNGYATGHHDLPERGDAMQRTALMTAQFDHLDRNDDGSISRAEMAAHADAGPMPGAVVNDSMGPDR